MSNETIIIKTPNGIQMYRLLALKYALALEVKGLGRRGRSVYSIVKQEFGFKGNKQNVLNQLIAHIEGLKG